MKKAKQVLALALAAVMIFAIAVPSAFAKTSANNYEVANLYPAEYTDGAQQYKFTAEQGAGYVLDLLDGLLYDAALDLSKEPVADVAVIGKIYLKADLTSIDTALYFLYNIVKAVTGGGSSYIERVVDSSIPNWLVSTVIGVLNLGDLENLNVDDLGDQNSNGSDRICRNVNYDQNKPTKTDLQVLMGLIKFLNTNAPTLSKIADGSISFGTLDSTIKGIDNVGPYLSDLPGALRKLLYQKLINSDYDTENDLPSGATVDSDLQKIINWFLVSGTGTTADDGGKSILGEGKEGFLPAIADYPGGASIDARSIQADRGEGVKTYTMNFYQLVNNALNALLSGYVSDLLKDLLIDMLGIDTSVNDGKGDTAIMSDMMFSTIVGAIESLCVANGAPAIEYTTDEETYPVPKITKLLDWFFNGGGLATFVKISYSGIQITDNFMSLLNDVARMLPGLFPLFGFEVPEGLTYTTEEMNEKWVDKYGDDVYLTYQGDEVYKHTVEGSDTVYYTFKDSGATVNTSDSGQSDYRNPSFIRPKYVLSNQNIYAALVKILLNHFIDGCYFPEWADTIPSVAAYALASLAAQYIPENNYFDRLDAYHASQIGETYLPRVGSSVTALPYTEQITLKSGKSVTVPRAAMDIGASLGAYLLSGWQDFEQGLGYKLETDTNFEVFAFEFLTWACATYMPIFAGKWNVTTRTFGNLSGSVKGTWQDQFNIAMNTFNTALANHPVGGTATYRINNIPASEIRDALYTLIDQTLFVLIPINWLPNWVAEDGSGGLINSWLLESLCTLDLQKIISLLGINTTGELNNSVTKVLINLVDRVLGTVFGGNPLLPPTSGRTVYSASTTLTTLDGLLGSTSSTPLKELLQKLLGHLNTYGETLCGVIFPLLLSGTVKSYSYYTSRDTTVKTNYLGGNQITLQELQDYVDSSSADLNAAPFSGYVFFNSDGRAADVAEKIGASFNKDSDWETIDGAKKFKVYFPETYSRLTNAEAATAYVDNSYVKRMTGSGISYQLLVKENYRTGTATENVNTVSTDANGAVTEREYVYSNINSVQAVKSNGTYQTGTKGKVVYGDGYRTSAREDFRAYELYYANRYLNAIDDAQEFIDSFNSYAHSTLPDAYGSWLMYFVKMQLFALGKYDADGDGEFETGAPGKPDKKTPYPFYATSGQSYESYIGPADTTIDQVRNVWKTGTNGQSYPFATNNSLAVVVEALAYADATEEDGSNHDVTFGLSDTEQIVRLATGNYTFKLTGDVDVDAAWAGLSAANRTAITTLCNSLGITFDSENNKITRKSFKLLNNSINGKTAFGSIDGTTISLTPITTYTPGAKDAAAVQNEIQKSYIEFAKTAREFNTHLNDYYDNLSWRTANREAALESNTVKTETLDWVLDYTESAYKFNGTRNKKYNAFNDLVTAYTAESYDEFQRAYEYGLALRAELSKTSHNHILQSLVTEAYKAILKSYLGLHEFGARPDWTQLEQLISMSEAILEGPLGIGETVDRATGYTLDTLNNLQSALATAQEFYNQNYVDRDIEFQDEIDEAVSVLQSVISALAFPEGIVPGAIKDPNPDNDSPLNILQIYDEEAGEMVDASYTLPGSSNAFKVIVGLEEGVNFTDMDGTMPSYDSNGESKPAFVSSGYVENGTSNTFGAVQSSYGGGTGSYLVGRVNTAQAFRYYAVLIGDLNGDARIDGTDKTIINMIIDEDKVAELESYLAVAADVNGDGQITSDDAAIIGLKTTHSPAFEGIAQTAGSGTSAWFN